MAVGLVAGRPPVRLFESLPVPPGGSGCARSRSLLDVWMPQSIISSFE